MKTTLLMPVLNEIDGLKAILPKIDRSWCDQILVMDGKSTDGTAEYAKEQGLEVFVQNNPGLKNGYLEAYDKMKGDIIIVFSPDGNSLAEMIPPLIKKMQEGYDMVIVSRYADGAKSYDDDLITGFGNWLFTAVINLLFRSHYTDTLVMYRAFRKNVIKDLELDQDWSYFPESLINTKIDFLPLMTVRVAKRGLSYSEIPGDEPPRIGGKRKLRVIKWGLAYMLQVFAEFLNYDNVLRARHHKQTLENPAKPR